MMSQSTEAPPTKLRGSQSEESGLEMAREDKLMAQIEEL